LSALDWEGCLNVRDLGGLKTADGRRTRSGALVRSDSPDRLTPTGWDAVRAHGIRTIVDLRNEDEYGTTAWPSGFDVVRLPLDGMEDDPEFWQRWGSGPQFGTPLYYRPHLDHLPERSARVIAAIARAQPGGVLVHCVGGRDRTGQVAMLVLALIGVPPEAIAADYDLSGPADEDVQRFLADRGTSAASVIVSTLADLDVEACLRLDEADLLALRARLVA